MISWWKIVPPSACHVKLAKLGVTHNYDDGQVRVSWARKSNILSADVLLSRLFKKKKTTEKENKHTQSLKFRTMTFCP